jgi:uncharacterized membrane protein
MRKFSIRPTLTLRGRQFKGLRGWAGKPAHPPLTDFPIVAYVLAAVFDVIASVGRHDAWARDFFRAGTYVFIGGAAVSLLTATTGFWDWLRSTQKGTQARRTANAHAGTMIVVTVLALVDIGLRLSVYHTRTHPTIAILVLSIVVALLVSFGATFGGTLVYDYGFNVETAGDSAVWHPSEIDVLPGDHHVDLTTPDTSTPDEPMSGPSPAHAGRGDPGHV